MQREAAFDLDRGDVFTAGDDHVVDAARYEQVAVLVEVSGVAGEIPALAQRLGVGLRPPPVAFEGFVARKQRDDLAFLADGRDLFRRRGAEFYDTDALINACLLYTSPSPR